MARDCEEVEGMEGDKNRVARSASSSTPLKIMLNENGNGVRRMENGHKGGEEDGETSTSTAKEGGESESDKRNNEEGEGGIEEDDEERRRKAFDKELEECLSECGHVTESEEKENGVEEGEDMEMDEKGKEEDEDENNGNGERQEEDEHDSVLIIRVPGEGDKAQIEDLRSDEILSDGTSELAIVQVIGNAKIPEKEKPEEDSDDENDRIGMIRIRDIGSLREVEDSDDEVVEVTPEGTKIVQPHTPYVYESKNMAFVPLDWDSDESRMLKSGVAVGKEQLKDRSVMCKRLLELASLVDEYNKLGTSGLNVRDKLPAVVPAPTSTLRTSTPTNGTQLNKHVWIPGGSPAQNPPASAGFIRVSGSSVSITQGRTIVSNPATGLPRTTNMSRPHILSPSSGNYQGRVIRLPPPSAPNMTQLVYDPRTGMLLYPSVSSSSPGMTASQQLANAKVRQQYRAIQAPPQLLAVLKNSGNTTTVSSTPQVGASAPSKTIVVSTAVPSSGPTRCPSPVSVFMRSPDRPATLQSMQAAARPIVQQIRGFKTYPPIASKRDEPARQAFSNKLPLPPKPRYPQPPSTAPPASAGFKRPPNTYGRLQQKAANQEAGNSQNPDAAATTFPSLLVTVKPILQEKLSKAQTSAFRHELDQKVKTILMQTNLKLSEWFMQQGMLKMDNKCMLHGNHYKLALCSDASKFLFSGGYVFTVDCCPDNQVSIFQGSILEGSSFPPQVSLKLMYHWACQTAASSVLTWVKVPSTHLKNFYTMLRSVCIAAVHEHASCIGGKGKYIEVGVTTLGTVSGQNRVEVLGVLDPAAKIVRLRLLNLTPPYSGEAARRRDRNQEIVLSLKRWIHKESVLLVDMGIEKSVLESAGFCNISQTKGAVGGSTSITVPTNVNVMNYLRNIVPKTFQHTTVGQLSKVLVQQFLDELTWRELWGHYPLKAFNSLIKHLAELTSADIVDTLISRLNKTSQNPFPDWSYSSKSLPIPSGIECLPDSITAQPLSELIANAAGMDVTISNLVSTYMNKANKNDRCPTKYAYGPASKTSRPPAVPMQSFVKVDELSTTSFGNKAGTKRKSNDGSGANLTKILQDGPKTHTLQAYYYVYCPSVVESYTVEFPANLKCPLCSKLLRSTNETMSHLISHVLSAGRMKPNLLSCKYCLKELQNQPLLDQHVEAFHKRTNHSNICRICVERFITEPCLILHMWNRHVSCEAPYRCEVCGYRSSFHYDVIDHFHKEHGATDIVQCPVCLKTFNIRSINCLKNVVAHLQNHVLRKGKRCQDCCLVFNTDAEHRTHYVVDSAHSSRVDTNYVQHAVDDAPIRMPKPPKVDRGLNIPLPPVKKQKTRKASGSSSNMHVMNSSIAIPLNPGDKFLFTPAKIKISDIEMYNKMNCWECEKPIALVGHYRGTMKCSRCRFETCCTYSIQKHVQTHDAVRTNSQLVEFKAEMARQTDLESDALECINCDFFSASTRRVAIHLSEKGHDACIPKNITS